MATILVVDDLPANRTILTTLLGRAGHRMLEAANGSEGLAAVRAHHPDLVITDVLMPVMDGYEFVRQLRFDPATRDTPVVFQTAHYGEREARELALAGGVAWVLTKPNRSEEVLAVVGRVLAGETEHSSGPAIVPLANFNREHMRLLTDKLSASTDDLRIANARLRALVNIGLELSAEHDADMMLQRVCIAARDLFGATYVTLGILETNDNTVRSLLVCGTDGNCTVDEADWIAIGGAAPGILRAVISGRRPLRGNNPGGDPAGLQLPPEHPEARAYLALPVASVARVYGWICLVSNEGRSFTAEDEQLATALAGQVGRVYELDHEILERGRAEALLRQERDRSQRFLDTAEVFLVALDLEGRITLINRYACSALGWTVDELLGRSWIETCIPARLHDQWWARFSALLAGDLRIVENPILTREGGERLVEWRNTLLRNEAGVAGTFSSGTDITERNQAVEELRTTEERTRYALEAAGVGIWDLDYSKGELRWSAILESQYGILPGAFDGTFAAFVARVHPEDRASLIETMTEAMRTGADFTVQHRALWPDGSIRWLNGAGRIRLGANGEPVRGLGISQDVTGRRQLESQYLQVQKMEAIGQLAGGVAHDFNNLITAILGYCAILLAETDADAPRTADIAEIQKAGESAARLTKQLLAFSRRQIIEPTTFDLNDVVAQMRPLLARLIREDVAVELRLQAEAVPVRADRGQVEQVVMNLAVNARDAMPAGGRLTIGTDSIELDVHYAAAHPGVKPGRFVVLTVSDTGTGMSPEVRARLFEPFFTTKGLGQGTGLGLATVHGIVERSGGSVNVYSEPGRGTAFKVYLPRADMDGVPAATPPAAISSGAGTETILVVEDSEGLRGLIRRLLERKGYTVVMADSANEAIALFEDNPSIDLLLTDVVMPGGSGPELSTRLTESRPGLKVVYMSGYTEDTITHRGVLIPGIAFLHKPFTADALTGKIRDVLDH